MNNKDNLSNQKKEYINNINSIIIQERLIEELLSSKKKLQKMISDAEELKKEKALIWMMPLLSWNILFSLVIGILVAILVSFEVLPSNITLPILGKMSTILVSLIGINIFASLGAIEDIDFYYRSFSSNLENQKINIKKLEFVESKIKSEKKYLEKLKHDKHSSIVTNTSNSNELERLKLLKDYLLLYVYSQYVPKSFFHEKDIFKCNREMYENYPYNLSDKKEIENEKVKTLLKK